MAFQLVCSFLIPILRMLGFMLVFRAFDEMHRETLRKVQIASDETNALLREVLAELKSGNGNHA
ncbi:MAG: hypothetical protein IT342_08610 [Candidatus Melainabacteria bacterium]|nr:hypothetical protein [Candidatus Melainabacteria bacterium]